MYVYDFCYCPCKRIYVLSYHPPQKLSSTLYNYNVFYLKTSTYIQYACIIYGITNKNNIINGNVNVIYISTCKVVKY